MIWNLIYTEKVFTTITKFQLSLTVNFLYNVECLYILQQINVNMCICIKDIKTTLLTFFTFLWTIHVAVLGNDYHSYFFPQSV
jgi:hypothetical protein